MNRRGFIGALAGLPIAAVVIPKVALSEVTAAPIQTIGSACTGQPITITINCDTLLFDSKIDKLHQYLNNALVARLKSGGVMGPRW